MIDSFNRYDVVVVKFPFASSTKYKARPAVIISNKHYNQYSRNTYLILAISSQLENKLAMEVEIQKWQEANLLKPSIFKASIATIEKDFVIHRLGALSQSDIQNLDTFLDTICF